MVTPYDRSNQALTSFFQTSSMKTLDGTNLQQRLWRHSLSKKGHTQAAQQRLWVPQPHIVNSFSILREAHHHPTNFQLGLCASFTSTTNYVSDHISIFPVAMFSKFFN